MPGFMASGKLRQEDRYKFEDSFAIENEALFQKKLKLKIIGFNLHLDSVFWVFCFVLFNQTF